MQVNVSCKTLKETIEILPYTSTTFCPKLGKKKDQPSVSDADQEIPTLWSLVYAGISVNLISGINRYARVGISRSAQVVSFIESSRRINQVLI